MPRIIFGTSTVGQHYTTPESVSALLDAVAASGISSIDTAALYPFVNIGQSEVLLGQADVVSRGFQVDTKILVTSANADGTLSPDKIRRSIDHSIQVLKTDVAHPIHVLYCHAPDTKTPLLDQLKALDEAHKRGDFQKLGVSNFPIETIKEMLDLCTEHNLIKPSVYQGGYNLISRDIEATLLPTLRKHAIAFHAFSPLATGFLSGNFSSGNVSGTRFDGDNVSATQLKAKYDKKPLHDAVASLAAVLGPHGLTNIEAALRWIAHHSALNDDDAVILGASNPTYIKQNVDTINKGPLPDDVVAAINAIWDVLQ